MAILAQKAEEVDFLKFLMKDLPTPGKISIITGTLYADWAAEAFSKSINSDCNSKLCSMIISDVNYARAIVEYWNHELRDGVSAANVVRPDQDQDQKSCFSCGAKVIF